MADWAATDFRKLYIPSVAFERLPYAARAVAADLIRRCDRQGHIVAGDRCDVTLVTDLAFHVRAHVTEEAFIRAAVEALLRDGYLVFQDGYLTIRNYVEAQKSSSAERMARKRQRDTGRAPSTVTSRSDASDVTDRHVGHSDESDQEERRGEEIEDPPNPPQGGSEGGTSGLLELAVRGYAAGVRAITHIAWSFPDQTTERAALRNLIALHAPGLKGERLEAKMTSVASRYAGANKDRAKYEGGFKPSKCLEWMNAGGAEPRRVSAIDVAAQRTNRAQEEALERAEGRQ